jgi:flagellar assembly protein FliH
MRAWSPESFDTRSETAARDVDSADTTIDLQTLQSKIREEAFLHGFKDGMEEGRRQGFAIGKEEGFEAGQTEGVRSGYQAGFEEGLKRLEPVGERLKESLDIIEQIPTELHSILTEWVYETALRIAGKESMDRAWFDSAVKDALGGLPKPGEQLIVRVAQQDLESWRSLLASGASDESRSVLVDPELSMGQAYVELRGLRIDIGAEARRALARNALGLTLTSP